MAAFTSVVVSNNTTSGATLTFNAASIDCNAQQLKQLHGLLEQLIVSSANLESVGSAATVTIGAQA